MRMLATTRKNRIASPRQRGHSNRRPTIAQRDRKRASVACISWQDPPANGLLSGRSILVMVVLINPSDI